METYVEFNTSNDETFYTAGYNEIFAVKGDADLVRITLYYNKSDKNVVDKNVNIIRTLEGVFRNNISIISPTFIIEYIGDIDFNYLYVDVLKRYYYIEDIVYISNSLIELNCKVDVLKTYANEIRNQSGFIEKAYYLKNEDVDKTNGVIDNDFTYSLPMNVEFYSLVNYAPFYSPNETPEIIVSGFDIHTDFEHSYTPTP